MAAIEAYRRQPGYGKAAAGEHSGPFRLGPLKQGGAPRGGCYQSRLVGSEVVFATL